MTHIAYKTSELEYFNFNTSKQIIELSQKSMQAY